MPSPLEKMRDVLLKMPADHRQKLTQAYQDFSRLKAWCEARKEIEILPRFRGIKVLKNTAEVKELKAIVDFLKPANFKWVAKPNKKPEAKKEILKEMLEPAGMCKCGNPKMYESDFCKECI